MRHDRPNQTAEIVLNGTTPGMKIFRQYLLNIPTTYRTVSSIRNILRANEFYKRNFIAVAKIITYQNIIVTSLKNSFDVRV